MARLPESPTPQSKPETRPNFKEQWRDNKEQWRDNTEQGRYLFDKCMAAGLLAQIGLLALVTAAFVLAGALLLTLIGLGNSPDDDFSFRETTWRSLMHAMDAGNVNDDEGWAFRGVMLSVTILGVVVMGGLIGILSNALTESMTRLRQGRSIVVEQDYTLILGWSPAVFNVVRELVKANQRKSGAHKKWRVVIMAVNNKVTMEDEIRAKLRKARLHRYNNRIICRTGNPIDVDDLGIVRPHMAQSIVILSPLGDDPDSHVIKTILAIQHTPTNGETRSDGKAPHIVHELRDATQNEHTAKLVGKGKDNREKVYIVDSGDIIARIIAQTCRQSGMSEIYTELLNYNDNQIYFHTVDATSWLCGKTFKQALLMLRDSVLIGLMPPKESKDSMLPPDMETDSMLPSDMEKVLIKEGDQIIFIGGSEDAVRVETKVKVKAPEILGHSAPKPEKTLILGWNARGRRILTELDGYVELDSQVKIVANTPSAESESAPHYASSFNHRVEFCRGDPTSPETLKELEIFNYDHIIVLGDHSLPPQQADMRTLVTLLNLRAILRDRAAKGKTAAPPLSIVSEMLVDGNRKLAEVTRDNDFIVSDKLVSSYMTQISQKKELERIFGELFDEEGAEIYLKPAEDYVTLDKPFDFYAVIAAAAARGECAIGYRDWHLCDNSEKRYGVKINPDKLELVIFEKGDRIIVIAQNEWGESPANESPANGAAPDALS